ncbi:MAG: hypothetical protein KF699_14390 [Phycisphaeraceae bacterium]|nr:hypothetical protein [Phycisphaeraceae bacterium]
MNLTARIKSLERKRDRGAGGAGCPLCGGAGWPAVFLFNEPPAIAAQRPPGWPVGCPSCGRIAARTWIGLGPSPTFEEARAFMEAL